MSWTNIHPTPRVRFAPSPTGYLHVGGARTALYNYMFAKKNGGEFILRIEDTDQERSTLESLKMVISDLKWLGLSWDEGPHPETLNDMGNYGPYKQSDRLAIYKKIADELMNKGKAYYCFLTDAEIELQREMASAENGAIQVNSPYKDWTLAQAQEKLQKGDKAVVRFKTGDIQKDYYLKDHVRGDVRFPSDMIGDFVLLRSDGMPVYNFCCAVDDHLMKMTHILRAEEHLPNTLRQMMIYEAMNWQMPEFAHISLVLDEDRQKLSKRKGAVACNQFSEDGYLPEAILNFIALLGWSHPEQKEVMTLQEMINGFSLERLNPSGAVFDRVKLKWMNAMHLRALPEPELWRRVQPFLDKNKVSYSSDSAWQQLAVKTFKPAMEVLTDAVLLFGLLEDSRFQILPEAQEVYGWGEPTKNVMTAWLTCLKEFSGEVISEADFLAIQDKVKLQTSTKGKNLFMPIRVAVIGKPHGTEIKILVPLMRKSSLIQRAEIALKGCS